jgi:pimeloyl-ACP methyl ester carboxylesterase
MFLSGIGGDHSLLTFGTRLTDEAYACFYDRPGDGPPPPDRPRTAGSDAVDLHELLDVAEIPTPVVLVAHSYGGLIAAIAAAKNPEDIAGVVFVDASLPGAEERSMPSSPMPSAPILTRGWKTSPTWTGRRASWRPPRRFRHFHPYRSP